MENSVIIHVLAEDLLRSAGREDGHPTAASDVILITTLKVVIPARQLSPRIVAGKENFYMS